MIYQAQHCEHKNPQFAYLAPNYGQAKRVAWEYLKEFTKPLPFRTVNEAELRIDLHRPGTDDKIRFMLLGAENPGSLRGLYLDGVVLDEYAEMDPTVWSQVIRPALSDRKGWAVFIGTPKGRNHFYETFYRAEMEDNKNWYAQILKASETGVIDEEELEEARVTMTEEEYNQEYECSFTAAMIGAYFGKEIEKARTENRITKVPYDPSVPVDTFWDLGISDTTAIWFAQQVGKEWHMIDYLEMSGVGLEWYAKQLKKSYRKNWLYGTHYLPHDAAARELGTGKSRQETLRSLGVRTNILQRWLIPDRIHAARIIMARTWFDETKCERGIQALENFQRKWDPKNKIFQDKPLHNWASHGADAFTYFAQGSKDQSQLMNLKHLPRHAAADYDVFGA